ncbi:HSP20 family protein [Burkholderia multivorans]
MTEQATKLPVKKEGEITRRPGAVQAWHPVEGLRREIDRLFDDFDRGLGGSSFRRSFFGIEPFWRRERTWVSAPAVDVAETDKAYEIVAELPGIDEKDIEVNLVSGGITIKGEKHEEKEEKKKDYYLHERHFGSFERYFPMPDGVDTEKVEATFKKGILTVILPKTQEAQKAEKKIPIKAS